jgi:Flp pilus assembly protein TadD
MDKKEITDTRTEAFRLLNLGQGADALDRVWQLLDRRNQDPRFWELRGTILTRLKMDLDAVRSYDRALDLNPPADLLPYVCNNKGISLFALGRYEEARVAFSQASERDWAFSAEAQNNLGLALMKLERPPDALRAFEEATRLKPNFAEAFNNRGQALEKLGRLEGARDSYDEAMRLRGHFSDALANRGRVFERLKEPEKALSDYEAAAAQSPTESRYELDCIRMLFALGRPGAARRLKALLARDPVFGRVAALFGTRPSTWWEWWFSTWNHGRPVLGGFLLLLFGASLILPLLRLRWSLPVKAGAPWHQYLLTAAGSLFLLLSPSIRRVRIGREGFEADFGPSDPTLSPPSLIQERPGTGPARGGDAELHPDP